MPAISNCSICHRSSSSQYTIHIAPLRNTAYNGQIVKRQFGDKQGMVVGSPTCTLCASFICPANEHNKRSPSWCHAWPACIWTCLTSPQYTDPNKFMQFLPHSLRQLWLPSIEQWLPAMRSAIDTPPHFQDVTPHLQNIKAHFESGVLSQVIKALLVASCSLMTS